MKYNILDDDLSAFAGKGPAFVTFGETMIRDTPADIERAERTKGVPVMSDRPFTFQISQPDGVPSQFDNHIVAGLARRFQAELARTIAPMWAVATREDRRWPATQDVEVLNPGQGWTPGRGHKAIPVSVSYSLA